MLNADASSQVTQEATSAALGSLRSGAALDRQSVGAVRLLYCQWNDRVHEACDEHDLVVFYNIPRHVVKIATAAIGAAARRLKMQIVANEEHTIVIANCAWEVSPKCWPECDGLDQAAVSISTETLSLVVVACSWQQTSKTTRMRALEAIVKSAIAFVQQTCHHCK